MDEHCPLTLMIYLLRMVMFNRDESNYQEDLSQRRYQYEIWMDHWWNIYSPLIHHYQRVPFGRYFRYFPLPRFLRVIDAVLDGFIFIQWISMDQRISLCVCPSAPPLQQTWYCQSSNRSTLTEAGDAHLSDHFGYWSSTETAEPPYKQWENTGKPSGKKGNMRKHLVSGGFDGKIIQRNEGN